MGDSSTTQSSNLARIRDNQRRSRARRKEYLQELESKHRKCEELGVQASAEIQAAARRVAEENKRLRALLRANGLSDTEIDAFTGGQDGIEGNTQFPSAAVLLDTMLSERRSCSGEAIRKSGGRETKHQKTAVKPKTALNAPAQHRGSVASIARASLSPSSTSASSFATTPIIPSYTVVTPTSEAGQQYPQARDMTFAHRQSHHLPHSQQYPQPHQYHQRELDYTEYHNTTSHFPPWQHPPVSYSNSINNGIVDHGQSTSCTFAADVLRGMGTEVSPEELHHRLGCTATGTECCVDNKVLFDVMDRYASGQGSAGP